MVLGNLRIWLNAQHQFMAIARRALQRIALRVAAATAAIPAMAAAHTRPRPTIPSRGAAGVAGAAAAGLGA